MSIHTTARVAVALVALASSLQVHPATPEEEKDALISQEARDFAPDGTDSLAGDPSRFEFPCEALPSPGTLTPHDGDDTNDGGWKLVDFCTDGATGANPANPPDCHHNDDDSAVLALPFTFDLYGDAFNQVFVNNNGNLSFGQRFSTFTATGFPVNGFPMVAPFWSDVDTGDPGDESLGHVWYKVLDGGTALAVTWDRVGYFFQNDDKLNTYQVIISDGTGARLGQGNNVGFCYDDMQWTTGDASGGVGGFGGTPATVGANRGDGIDFFEFGRFDASGAGAGGVDGLDGLGAGAGAPILFNASSENVAPVASGFPSGDRASATCNEPFHLAVEFSSPEGDQTTTVAIEDPDGAQDRGLVVTNTPGQTAVVDLDWEPGPDAQGSYVLTLTATDDFQPAGETERSLTIDVECFESTPLPSVSEELTGVASNSRTGAAVSGAGNLNGDSAGARELFDLIAGAPGTERDDGTDTVLPEVGAAAVYLGSTVEAERAEADVVFLGEAAHDRAGVAVAGDFDFDGDGVPDLMIGAEQVDRTDPDPENHSATGNGLVYLVYFDPADYPNLGNPSVRDTVNLSRVACTARGTCNGEPEIDGVVFTGASLGDQAGFSVAGGGDVGAGPSPDIAIGAPGRDAGALVDAGTAYLIFNQSLAGTVDLSLVACSVSATCGGGAEIDGIVYEGAASGDRLGWSVAFPGDVVEPAGDDFAMGAPEADVEVSAVADSLQDAGTSFIASGGALAKGIVEVCEIGSPGQSAAAGSFEVDGVQIRGDQAGMKLGYSVAGGGDNLGGDGEDDLLVGAPFFDAGDEATDQTEADVGQVAQTSGVLARGIVEVCEIGTPGSDQGIEGARYVGAEPGDQLGIAVAGLDDVTGNGGVDIAMGAPFANPDGIVDAGVVYVVEGNDGLQDTLANRGIVEVCEIGGPNLSGRALSGTEPNQEAGSSLSGTGDTTGDGQNDFAAGSPGDDGDSGSVSLVDEGTDVATTRPNSAPVADAGASQTTAECTGGLEGPAQLDGTLSFDPDGDALDQFTWLDQTNVVIATGAQPPPVNLPLGLNDVRLDVSDVFGAVGSTSIAVLVEDTAAPEPTCPADVTEECDRPGQAQVSVPLVTADDACDNGETLTNDFNAGGADASGLYPLESTVVTFTATDDDGNSSQCQVQVTVEDTTGPDVTCPANASEECQSALQAQVILPATTADDLCDNGETVVNDYNAGGADASGSYPLGVTTVVFTARDDDDNSETCQTSVTVVDETPPTVSCPVEVVQECESNLEARVSVPAATADDACDNGETIVNDYNAGGADASDTYPWGDTTVTFTASDDDGNSAICESTVSVVDTENPFGEVVSPPDGACFGASDVFVTDGFDDACDPDLLKTYACQGPCGSSQAPPYSSHGDHTVTVTVEDEAGLTASDLVSFTIDDVPPSVSITSPPETATLPVDLPLDVLFTSDDDDGATGGIFNEIIELDGCTVYDARDFGDDDGVFEGPPDDPAVTLDQAELCRIAEACGFTSLVEPELTVKVIDDCGGNVGEDSRALGGSVALRPGLCSSIALQLAFGAATTADWDLQDGAMHYDVIRGSLRELAVDGEEIDLGEVACVEDASSDTTTAGNEDEALPSSGEVFFFLVESFDGQVPSGWGHDSAGRNRVIRDGNGGCR